jgi:hypothetical protein
MLTKINKAFLLYLYKNQSIQTLRSVVQTISSSQIYQLSHHIQFCTLKSTQLKQYMQFQSSPS